MTQHPKGREWTITVCNVCGQHHHSHYVTDPCKMRGCPGRVVSIAVVPAARLREVEEEREQWRVKYVATVEKLLNQPVSDVARGLANSLEVAAERDRAEAAESLLAAVREWLALNEKSEQPNGPPLKEADLEWVRGFNFCRKGLLSVLDQPPSEEER